MDENDKTDVASLYSNGDGRRGIHFMCPGCNEIHGIIIEKTGNAVGPCWQWNKSLVTPTSTPSILVTFPANPEATEEFKEWRTKRVCHSYVTDGKIRFLNDSWHQLKGQTVQLPTVANWWKDK